MSLSANDLRPERTLDVIDTIERLRGPEYAHRLRFAVNLSSLLSQCEQAVLDGNRVAACITASLAVSFLETDMPEILGLSATDIAAGLKAQSSDKADILNKLRQEFGK